MAALGALLGAKRFDDQGLKIHLLPLPLPGYPDHDPAGLISMTTGPGIRADPDVTAGRTAHARGVLGVPVLADRGDLSVADGEDADVAVV
jgi:hypothetical protein